MDPLPADDGTGQADVAAVPTAQGGADDGMLRAYIKDWVALIRLESGAKCS